MAGTKSDKITPTVEGATDTPPAKDPLSGLTVGRIVHYMPMHTSRHHAAIIIDILDKETGIVEVLPFWSSLEKYPPREGGIRNVTFDQEGKLPGSWHWIEFAP